MAENKNWIDRFLGFLLGNNGKKFEEVILDREVVGEIIQIARESHPLEFVALLEGKIKEKNFKSRWSCLFTRGNIPPGGSDENLHDAPHHRYSGIGAQPSHSQCFSFYRRPAFFLPKMACFT
nr:hypothetical protein [Methanobacterium formicicum]